MPFTAAISIFGRNSASPQWAQLWSDIIYNKNI